MSKWIVWFNYFNNEVVFGEFDCELEAFESIDRHKKECIKNGIKPIDLIVRKPKIQEDIVNTPNHYHKGGVDVLTFVDGKLSSERIAGFYQINILKYVTRYKEKNGIEDLNKAEFYLKKLIELENKNNEHK